MDIAALLLWIFTAAAGVYLLGAAKPARDSADSAAGLAAESGGTAASAAAGPGAAPAAVPVAAGGSGGSPGRRPATAGVPQAAAAAYAAGAKVPPITHTRITTRPDEHPLLEFLHPALGIVGLGGWIAFVVTRYSAFAWIAFGVLVVTIIAGLTWLMVNHRATRRAATPDRSHPKQRILLHGAGAAVTFVLAVVTALIASHP